MDVGKYLVGRGLDVSRGKDNFIEPDNFYTLKKFCEYESQDYIYSRGVINETKFFRILIKEWINFCKVGGHIIIEMRSNKILDFENLLKESEVLIGDKGKIVLKESSSRKSGGVIVLKKTKQILAKDDSIDKWTFGIITGGVTDGQVDKGIRSVLDLKIPHFEVIICGVYNGVYKNNKNVRYIHFDVPLPWITKKKNIICEASKYENMVIFHDHCSIRKNWYAGMKKYGNYFEVLCCPLFDPKGRRAQDWMTYGIPLTDFSKDAFKGASGLLEYKDWDKDIDVGAFAIMKRTIWEKCPWDERLLLFQADDMKISGDFYNAGVVTRFNINSYAETSKAEWGGNHGITYGFNKVKRGKPTSTSRKFLITYYIKNFIYNRFGVYLKRANAHSETKRIFAIPMK